MGDWKLPVLVTELILILFFFMIKPIKAILQQNLSRLGYSFQVTCSSSYDKSDCSINQCNLETCRNSLE